MASLSAKRLGQERIQFKKNHPFGFYAKFSKKETGEQDLYKWNCGIATDPKGPWKGVVLKMRLEFHEDYPARPPKAVFEKIDGETLFHPNIYPSGTVCLR